MAGHSDQNIVDHAAEMEEYENNPNYSIRLHRGLDLNAIANGDGSIFEPELVIPEENHEERSYYLSEEAMRLHLGELPENNELPDAGSEDFEELAKTMEVLAGTDGCVRKKIMKHGLTTCDLPPPRGTVTIHYSLYIEHQDEPFDSSILRGKMERFRLDDGRMIFGMEAGVKSMRKKERSRFLIEPNYAFGEVGCPPRVAPKSQILADIQLVDFVQEAEADALLAMEPEERSKARSFSEVFKVAFVEKDNGNSYYKEEEYSAAARSYSKAIRLLQDVTMQNDDEETKRNDLLKLILLNRAMCNLKLSRSRLTCLDCKSVLKLDPRNRKALYHMAKAKRALGDLQDAEKLLQRSNKLGKPDEAIGRELLLVQNLIKKERQDTKDLCQKMMANLGKNKNAAQEQSDEEQLYEKMREKISAFVASPDQKLTLPSLVNGSTFNTTKQIVESFSNLKIAQDESDQLVILKTDQV